MQRYIFTRGMCLFQLCCLFLSAAGFATETERQYLEHTEALLERIEQVNREWNGRIKYKTDLEHYGFLDRWIFPADGFGDCEDFAIAKKEALEQMGIPSFFSICRSKPGSTHVVLLVFTNKGALVLDNTTDLVLLASQTRYEWLFVQFPGDVWRHYETNKMVSAPHGYLVYKARRTSLKKRDEQSLKP